MIVHPTFTEVCCDACNKQTTNFVPSSKDSASVARNRARYGGWRLYKNKNKRYDKCPQCKPPQGPGWELMT